MTTDLTRRLAIYPMMEESDATGVVAATDSQVLQRVPLVPSLFKSLAVCPAYLVLAWRQVDAVFTATTSPTPPSGCPPRWPMW